MEANCTGNYHCVFICHYVKMFLQPSILQKMNLSGVCPLKFRCISSDLIISVFAAASRSSIAPSACHQMQLWKYMDSFGGKRDCSMQLSVLERLVCCPTDLDQCSSGLHTVGYLRYHTVLHLFSFNMRNMLMFATPVVFFSHLHFNSRGATCSFCRDNACQALGNNTE